MVSSVDSRKLPLIDVMDFTSGRHSARGPGCADHLTGISKPILMHRRTLLWEFRNLASLLEMFEVCRLRFLTTWGPGRLSRRRAARFPNCDNGAA